MPESFVDLGAPTFWCFAVAALFLVVPLTRTRLRWLSISALDLGFICALVGPRLGSFALLFAIAVHLSCRFMSRAPRTLVGLAGAATLLLFLAHKLRSFPALPDLTRVLAAVGFSYVALRSVDLLRCMREGTHAPPDFSKTLAYLFPFHMLAAGPIQAYSEFAEQEPVPEKLGLRGSLEGFDLVARGLFKKYVIAQAIDAVFLTQFRVGGAYFWLELQAFYLWVYLDFSAVSDIALGLGRLLGIATPKNFDRPLTARNIIEFWERWHISLSTFIRRQLFIPLQLFGMRKTGGARPLLIASLAFTVSFVLCGLWHGVSLRFLAWGAIHAGGLVVCNSYKHWLRRRLGRAGLVRYLENRGVRVLATLITFEYVALSLAFVAYPFTGYLR